MIVSSLQIILSSKPNTRKTFVIGIPLIFGLSLQALPELCAQVVPWLRPLFGSALTLATVLAGMLNLLLGVGGPKAQAASVISGGE
jgi:NCS2 family nucleobase:cation symporter-2